MFLSVKGSGNFVPASSDLPAMATDNSSRYVAEVHSRIFLNGVAEDWAGTHSTTELCPSLAFKISLYNVEKYLQLTLTNRLSAKEAGLSTSVKAGGPVPMICQRTYNMVAPPDTRSVILKRSPFLNTTRLWKGKEREE